MATHAASIAVEFVDPNRHSFAQEFSREDTLGAARELLLAHLRIGGDQLRIFFQVPTRVGQTKTQTLIAWEDELTFGELAFLWTKDMDARKQGMRTMSGKEGFQVHYMTNGSECAAPCPRFSEAAEGSDHGEGKKEADDDALTTLKFITTKEGVVITPLESVHPSSAIDTLLMMIGASADFPDGITLQIDGGAVHGSRLISEFSFNTLRQMRRNLWLLDASGSRWAFCYF